jgi:predicted dehydrogenase
METIKSPFDAPALNWGIIGPGGIAGAVTDCLTRATKQNLLAVASRSVERGQAFAQKFGAARVYSSYAELVADPDIDVVYVATLHHTHHGAAKLALEAGKAVLLEKAFTMNQEEAADLLQTAKERDVFLMEAMWTRFLPQQVELRNRIAAGVIGEPRFASNDFGFRNDFDAASRFYDPAVGGGALLDRGIYSISWVADLLGIPEGVVAKAHLAPSGVDAQFSAVLDYPGKLAQATVEAAVNITTPQDAWISGTEGMIRIPSRWWQPSSLEIHTGDNDIETWSYPVKAAGYEYEIAEVARRVANGEKFSPNMTPEDSVAIMGVLDEIRRQTGVVFPGDPA